MWAYYTLRRPVIWGQYSTAVLLAADYHEQWSSLPIKDTAYYFQYF